MVAAARAGCHDLVVAEPPIEELEEKFRAYYAGMEKPSRAALDQALAEPSADERTLVLVAFGRMRDIVRLADDEEPEAQVALTMLSSALKLAAIGAKGRSYRIDDTDFALLVPASGASPMLAELASQLHGFEFNAGGVTFTGPGDPDALLKRAANALRRAKKRGHSETELV
jgi:hypothetical protein